MIGARYAAFVRVMLGSVLLVPACGSDDDNDAKPGDAGTSDSSTGGTGGTSGTGGTGGTSGTAGTGGTSGTAGTGGAAGMDAGVDAADAATCTPVSGDSDPPTIVSAALIAPDKVSITFSERVAPPTGVDPAKFRISVASTYSGEGLDYTRYSDPTGYQDAGANGYEITALEGQCTTQITATVASPIANASICPVIEALAGFGDQAGLYLHFRSAGSPTIEDPAGNALADVSPEFATPGDGGTLPDQVRVSGSIFPDSPPSIPINCTDGGGAGGAAGGGGAAGTGN